MLRAAAGLAIVPLLMGCGDDSTTEPPSDLPDTGPPVVTVVHPVGSSIDRDGDGLVDIELAWADSAGIVDRWGVVALNSRGLGGSATSETNLLHAWEVTRLDTTGVVLHETLDNLLHPGDNEIVFTVPDTAGNIASVALRVSVPPLALHKVIDLGQWISADAFGLCGSELVAYAPAVSGYYMAEIDLGTMAVARTDTFPVGTSVILGGTAYKILCLPYDRRVWVTAHRRFGYFDRFSRTWHPHLLSPGTDTWGITQSKADPNLLYVAETDSADVGIIDRTGAVQIGAIGLPLTEPPLGTMPALVVLAGDTKIYVASYSGAGLLAADPATGTILKHFDFAPSIPDYGNVADLALSPDESRLYVSVSDGEPPGIREIDTATDEVLRTLDLSVWPPRRLSLSPDGRRLFVGTYKDLASQTQHVLIDVAAWTILQGVPRQRDPGDYAFTRSIAFHPSGTSILLEHSGDIDVYLNRD